MNVSNLLMYHTLNEKNSILVLQTHKMLCFGQGRIQDLVYNTTF